MATETNFFSSPAMTSLFRQLHRSAKSGFTLLEMLVVLSILSAVMLLLMQGLSSVYRIHRSVHHSIITLRPDTLRQRWLYDLLTAMTADGINRSSVFSGTSTAINGLTLAPLLTATGVATPISLVIKENGEGCSLFYREGSGHSLLLGNWQQERCFFRYLHEGRLINNWDLRKNRSDLQLPAGILFTTVNSASQQQTNIFAAVQSLRYNRGFVSDLLDE